MRVQFGQKEKFKSPLEAFKLTFKKLINRHLNSLLTFFY